MIRADPEIPVTVALVNHEVDPAIGCPYIISVSRPNRQYCVTADEFNRSERGCVVPIIINQPKNGGTYLHRILR